MHGDLKVLIKTLVLMILQYSSLYLILPILLTAIISRYALRLNTRDVLLITSVVMLLCIGLFLLYGFPDFVQAFLDKTGQPEL